MPTKVRVRLEVIADVDLATFRDIREEQDADISLAVAVACLPKTWPDGVTPVERSASFVGFVAGGNQGSEAERAVSTAASEAK